MEVKEPETTVKYKTVAEIAAELRVTPQCIYQFVKDGKLPTTHVGRAMRVKVEDYERFLKERSTGSAKS